VRVAVVDSGWNHRIPHPRVGAGIGLVHPDEEFGLRRSDDDNDRNGHGTTCSRIVLFTAPQAMVLPIRVFGRRLETTVDHLCEALRIAVEKGVEVVNMSLATTSGDAVVRLYAACEYARNHGITIVAAADGRTKLGFPAVFENVVGVRAGNVDSPSSVEFHPEEPVKFVACGTLPWLRPKLEGEVRRGSSSFAAAHLSGIVVRYLADTPGANLDAVRQHLADRAAQGASSLMPRTV
jgi:hypothetical protein